MYIETINIDKTIKEMTVLDKAKLINGCTFMGTYAFNEYGIKNLLLLDGVTGINYEQLFFEIAEREHFVESKAYQKMYEGESNPPKSVSGTMAMVHVTENFFSPENLTEKEYYLYEWLKEKLNDRLDGKEYAPGCFPPGILLGSTFNEEIVHNVGNALGMESCLYGVHMLLGPNVNLQRDPRNGRLFESYSEDPYVISKLGCAMIKGIQEYGVAATAKHYAANNQETNRQGIDEAISNRALEEIYLKGFKACIKDADAKAIMNAYNQINGEACTESRWLLIDKLREEYGFKGLVVSDWGAARRKVESLIGGTNLCMPGFSDHMPIYEAVMDGRIKEEVLDDAVMHILELINYNIENYKDKEIKSKDINEIKAVTDQIAYEAAVEGIVLLKNDNICPIKEGTKIAIAGSGVNEFLECGSGSAGIDTNRHGDLVEELGEIYDVFVYHEDENSHDIYGMSDSLGEVDTVLFVCTIPGMEGNDRETLSLKNEDLKQIKKLADEGKEIVLILNVCGPVDLSEIDNLVKAIYVTYFPGMMGTKALKDLISGQETPSGKLAVTFAKKMEDLPSYLNFPGDLFHVNYGEGIYVGYRYYDKKKIEPQYAFGYGLSYTDFCVSLNQVEVRNDKRQIDIYASVKNIGKYKGAEVLQIYVRDQKASIDRPVKELKAFKKVSLHRGETKDALLKIPFDELAYFDPNGHEWVLEEGYFDIILATSSDEKDIVATETIYVDVKSKYSYGRDSQLKTVYDTCELKEILFSMWEERKWDFGVIYNNYQYSNHRRIKEILDDLENVDSFVKEDFLSSFEEAVKTVLKP